MTATIITLALFYLIIKMLVNFGYEFNSKNFILKYLFGLNCYACFSVRVAFVVQIFYLIFGHGFDFLPIFTTFVVINLTNR